MPVDAGMQLAWGTAPSPSFTDLEAFTVRLGRADWHIFDDGSKPIPIPNADMLEFGWPHVLALVVNTSSPGVVITNRRFEVQYLAAPPVYLWYGLLPAYRQSVEANMPDPIVNGGTPTPKGAGAPPSYIPLVPPHEPVLYDDTPVEALAGSNGKFIEIVLGVLGQQGVGSSINYLSYQARIMWDER